MPIKDFLIPNYLQNLESGRAEIEANRSGANLNNVQASRIMSLLPGEMEKQGIDIEGGRLDNIGKGVDIEGQTIVNKGNSILNNINRLKVRGERYTNETLRVAAGAAENNMELEQEGKKLEILKARAEIQQANAMTKQAMSTMDSNTRKSYNEEYYPKMASSMKTIRRLSDGGDLQSANSIYQALLKALPPEVLQFEGKNGMDLLGPEIDPEDLKPMPGYGGMSKLQIFEEHLSGMVPSNSQMGMLARQREQNANDLIEAETAVSGKGVNDALKTEKLTQEIDKNRRSKLFTPLVQGISGGSTESGGVLNDDGVIDSPTVSYAVNKLLSVATKADKDGKDVIGGMSKVFSVAELESADWGIDQGKMIIPRNEKHLKRFLEGIQVRQDANGDTPQEAYQKEFDKYLKEPSVIENIFN